MGYAERDGLRDDEVATASEPGPGGPPRPSAAVIEQVRQSCRLVADRPVLLAETFYQHLFAMAPQTRAMFPPDMSGQMQKMSDTLLSAITTLAGEDTAALEGVLRRLGAQHRTRYGVETDHYLYIGHALTRAVRDVAGARWSGSLSSAWIAVYQWVAAHMIDGSTAPDLASAPEPASAEQDLADTRRPVPDIPAAGIPLQRAGARSDAERADPHRLGRR